MFAGTGRLLKDGSASSPPDNWSGDTAGRGLLAVSGQRLPKACGVRTDGHFIPRSLGYVAVELIPKHLDSRDLVIARACT